MSRVAHLTAWVALALLGCAEERTPEEERGRFVGTRCAPEAVPEGGFDPDDSYLETSAVHCRTRVCGVFGFEGDPSRAFEECLVDGGVEATCEGLPSYESILERVFCTCRCEAFDAEAATCACPDGFVCQPLIEEEAGPGIAGSYCVRDGFPAP